jgi:hypothetical protein
MLYIATNKNLYFFIKISTIIGIRYNNNCKVKIYNNIYIQLMLNVKLNINTKIQNSAELNSYFLNHKIKKFNNLLFNFFNNYFVNFISLFLKKKLFFCVKKLNRLSKHIRKNKTLIFMSRKLKKFYRFAGGLKFFRQFIEIL